VTKVPNPLDRQTVGVSFPFDFSSRGGVSNHYLMNTPEAKLKQIQQSVEQIIGTEPGERVNEPTFGCSLRKYLFKSNLLDDITVQTAIKIEILNALTTFETRITVRDIQISSSKDNVINILVNYSIKDTGNQDATMISLR
jgi:phage baseplate assembly protein W